MASLFHLLIVGHWRIEKCEVPFCINRGAPPIYCNQRITSNTLPLLFHHFQCYLPISKAVFVEKSLCPSHGSIELLVRDGSQNSKLYPEKINPAVPFIKINMLILSVENEKGRKLSDNLFYDKMPPSQT